MGTFSRFLCYSGFEKKAVESSSCSQSCRCGMNGVKKCWCTDVDKAAVVAVLQQSARVKVHVGNHKEAITVWNQCLAIQRNTVGRKHPSVARTLLSIGMSLNTMGETYLALTAFEESLWILQETLGAGHEETAAAAHNLWLLLHNETTYTSDDATEKISNSSSSSGGGKVSV